MEWCPPGHGDLYAALEGSGTLDKLLADGIKYMFVSNSDNLGAVMDLTLLTHFAESDSPFMMECADRTVNDKKGGHLAVRNADSQLILREAAMCPVRCGCGHLDATIPTVPVSTHCPDDATAAHRRRRRHLPG